MIVNNYFKVMTGAWSCEVFTFNARTVAVALAEARSLATGPGTISVWRRVPGVPASVPEVGELSPVVVREEAA